MGEMFTDSLLMLFFIMFRKPAIIFNKISGSLTAHLTKQLLNHLSLSVIQCKCKFNGNIIVRSCK